MIILKFVVLFGCISIFSALQTYYSEICSNHTLFKYKIQGPSVACQSYDSKALLSNQETKDIIENINEKTNFIAMGYSQNFPQAANMKKIHWSSELARNAQLWADQCEPSPFTHRELDHKGPGKCKIGLLVGTASPPPPDLTVTHFIDKWFKQIKDFAGNVTYYNKIKNNKTYCFTQLIWSETEFVGCAKVKFYVDQYQSIIERLVCMFLPSGNIHGTPIYAIGEPRTQCSRNTIADDKFKGLCDHEDPKIDKKLFNSSISGKIDPIGNLFKNNNTFNQKKIKTRHITNNSYIAVRYPPLRKPSSRKNLPRNLSRNLDDDYLQHDQDRGHSRMYHGHNVQPSTANYFQRINQNFGSRDYTTRGVGPVYIISSPNYRRNSERQACTRKLGHKCNEQCQSYECTRRPPCCPEITTCSTEPCETFTNPDLSNNNVCSCTRQCPTTTQCPPPPLSLSHDCNTNCKCSHCAVQPYANIPNMVRSGNHKTTSEFISTNDVSEQLPDSETSRIYKIIHVRKETDQLHKQSKDEINHSKYNIPDRDYVYGSFDSSYRNKRELKDDSQKPFWKINEMKIPKVPELRAMQFTTLADRNPRNRRRKMQSITQFITTEPITIKTEDDSNDENVDQVQTTEKYLSFNELMFLRKFSDNFMDQNARRTAKTTKATTKPTAKPNAATTKATTKPTTKATTKPTTKATTKPTTKPTTKATTKAPQPEQMKGSPSEYTTNTPFERKKHCTRKLTCTWTIYTGTGTGDGIGPLIETGSRTPPGYVEGCTRTSTCTRDFQERNKPATPSGTPSGGDWSEEGGEGGDGGDGTHQDGDGEDGDYCEKRALNVQRRNADYEDVTVVPTIQTNVTLPISNITVKDVSEIPQIIHKCACNKKIRMKREDNALYMEKSKVLSYADIYYLVLNKIINRVNPDESCAAKKCPCNSKHRNKMFSFYMYAFMIYLIL